jgi:hypothetical protein
MHGQKNIKLCIAEQAKRVTEMYTISEVHFLINLNCSRDNVRFVLVLPERRSDNNK